MTVMTKTLPAIRFDHESVRVFAPAKRPTVYRVLAMDGELLYRGASIAPRRRLHEHLRLSDFEDAAFVELEFFRNATAMAKAERSSPPGIYNIERGKQNGAWRTRRW